MSTNEANKKNTSLKWDVFITPGIPVVTSTPAPNTKETFWNPTSSTLIYGKRDAVLVDVPTTWQQTVTLACWVRDSCKNLTTIYITHGHADHWFGVSALLDRFPNAKVVATRGTVKVMREEVEPRRTKIWNAFFPGQIPNQLVIAEGNTIDLEGNELRAVELGHTDWQDTTCLYVPSIGLAVAGDAAFNGTHMFLGASPTPQKRKEWISALDKIESLNPRAVIAGHKRPGRDDDPRIIEETRQYIRDFDRLAESSKTARELYDQMLKLHPDGSNPHILWLGALAAKS
jgi:glyoxylase-like metal-dependent hydrolase (beta-lactamase superfamily II)